MKYKIGQRVKFLPSAREDGIPRSAIGKDCIITTSDIPPFLRVRMIPPFVREYWYVNRNHIERVIQIGQQLLFPFMEE